MSTIYDHINRIAKITWQRPVVIVMSALLLGLAVVVTACGGQDTPVKATWIEPQISGDTITILEDDVNNSKIVHFRVPVALGGEMTFMAYNNGGKLTVRANVCPPCRSIGFSLSKNTLICDTCQTTFNAKTGEGISGACVAYPKASVRHSISDGRIVMTGSDLLIAYQNTIQRDWP